MRPSANLTTLARLLFGFIYFINGLNWLIKLLPYPSMHDPRMPHTPPFVQCLLDTGFMFTLVRAIELAAGVALLTNFWAPLTLVAIFPITLIIWLVDFFLLGQNLRAQVMGWSVLLLNVALLFGHLDLYRPMLTMSVSDTSLERRRSLQVFTVAACIAGVLAAVWLCVMVFIQISANRR